MELNQESIKNAVKSTVDGLVDFYIDMLESPPEIISDNDGTTLKVYPKIKTPFDVEINIGNLKTKFTLSVHLDLIGDTNHNEASEQKP